jgi:hypothetical protein
MLTTPTGVQPGEVEWPLWRGSFCDWKLTLLITFPLPHFPHIQLPCLFHGAIAPWVGPLRLLCAHALCMCCLRGEPHDGCRERCSQFLDGHHHWSWDPGMTIFHTQDLFRYTKERKNSNKTKHLHSYISYEAI